MQYGVQTNRSKYHYMQVCSILDSGQATAGQEGIFCNNDELRKIFNATCSNMDCGQLTAPINGTVTMNSTKYEGIASFACDTGFYMSGSNTTSCNASGNWDTTTPSCFPIDCGDVQPPLNGYVSYTNSTFNETATFSCQIGFVMSGYNITTCDSSGKWNNRPPNCSMINCGDLHVPENGFMIMSRNTTILGTNATFSCAKGYILIGSASRSCLSNGAWSGFHPVCTEHNGKIVVQVKVKHFFMVFSFVKNMMISFNFIIIYVFI
ncbi:hypothetical protein DPMN_124023 [Dreissena polymorpha]|uniref:Sushi domain-containing protein n=1 Tax=Dreissena polymorpha TaxID=45954 RepID=A0A9D4GS05_DREPO|nr:hypothetical protein DPMN_124023 [Dreissena polymorpha]